MKPLITLLLALTLSSQTAFTQESTNAQPYIEVTGHAEKKVVPDEIYVAITIRERVNGKDKITVEQQETELRKALQELGIPEESLSVSDAQADYIRVKWSKKDVVSQSEYELKLATAKEVSDVFGQLDKLDIHNAYISRTSHSKIKELIKDVEIEAIKSAKAKADYLLAAIGQRTGAALIINERSLTLNGSNNGINVRGSRGNADYVWIEGESLKLGTVEFKKIVLESNIYAKFKIE